MSQFHAGRIVFFVASRGHHADVGGITPGSMPPNSKTLSEEGAAIIAFKLVRKGAFQEAGVYWPTPRVPTSQKAECNRAIVLQASRSFSRPQARRECPGCSGSRNLPRLSQRSPRPGEAQKAEGSVAVTWCPATCVSLIGRSEPDGDPARTRAHCRVRSSKVQAYMHHIQVDAEVAVRDFLVRFSPAAGPARARHNSSG